MQVKKQQLKLEMELWAGSKLGKKYIKLYIITLCIWFICRIVAQSLSHVWFFVALWTQGCQNSLSFTTSLSLLKLTSIEPVMPSNNLILCHPLLLLPSIFPSIWVFSNECNLHHVTKALELHFGIDSSNEYSGLISFRIDWFVLLAVQVILKSLLQVHSSKASLLQCSAFFMVWLLHPYMGTRKI